MSVDPVLDYSITVRVTMIRSGLCESVREGPCVSNDLWRGTVNFSASHFLPLNRPDYLREYSPYYPLMGRTIIMRISSMGSE
jgi:hypothetical protein